MKSRWSLSESMFSGIITIGIHGRVISVKGKLRKRIIKLALGRPEVLLDLSNMSKIDPAALNELASALNIIKIFGGTVELLRPRVNMDGLSRGSQQFCGFPVFEKEKEALTGFHRQSFLTICRQLRLIVELRQKETPKAAVAS